MVTHQVFPEVTLLQLASHLGMTDGVLKHAGHKPAAQAIDRNAGPMHLRRQRQHLQHNGRRLEVRNSVMQGADCVEVSHSSISFRALRTFLTALAISKWFASVPHKQPHMASVSLKKAQIMQRITHRAGRLTL